MFEPQLSGIPTEYCKTAGLWRIATIHQRSVSDHYVP